MGLALLAGSCGTSDRIGGGDGALNLAITQAPADVQCIDVRVVGTRTVQRRIGVVPGDETVFTIGGLPVGAVQVEGEAYDEICDDVSGEPGWLGGPVGATLVGGTPANVTLPMRRNARAIVAVDFEEETACSGDGAACGASTQCCSLNCAPDPADPSGGGYCAPAPECPTGLTPCAGACVDVQSDANHCGACFQTCPAGDVCADGQCTAGTCGNGALDPGEACDDGQPNDGDGCSSTCAIEPGWSCTGQPSACTPSVCGDGICSAIEDCASCPSDCPC